MKKIIYLTMFLSILFFNSLYLTGVVRRYTLSTNLQYFFVICYFFIFLGIIGFYLLRLLKNRLKENKIWVSKSILIALFLSLILISAGGDLFNNHKYQMSTVTITATGDKNEQSNSAEVWITSVKINNSNVDLQNLSKSVTGIWQFKEGALLSDSNEPSIISINLPAKKDIKISFLKHNWSGIVSIKDGNVSKQIDLYSQNSSEYVYSVEGNKALFSSKVIFDYLMSFLFCFTTISLILSLAAVNSYFLGLFYFCLYVFLFVFIRFMDIDKLTDVFFMAVTVAVGAFFGRTIVKKRLVDIIPNKLSIVLLILIVLYSSFAFVGTSLFFKTGVLYLSFQNISIFILVCLWILPFIIACIQSMGIKKNLTLRASNSHSIKLWFILFFIQIVFGLIYLIAYFPANMSLDSIRQWAQVYGLEQMSDWHPVVHTMLNKLILLVFESPASIALFQIFFSASIVSSFLILFFRNGFPKKWLISFAILFSLIPNNGINLVTLWKDIPFTISLLWLTLLLARMKIYGDKTLTLLNYVSLTIALVGTCLLRHNGIVPFLLTISILIVIVVRSKNLKMFGSILASIILIVLIKGTINTYYDVIPNPEGIKLVAPVHGMASVIYHDGSLSNDTKDFMNELMPKKDWKRLYTPYSANSYMFDNDFGIVDKLSSQNTIAVIKKYLDTFYRNPSIVLYDRLTGVNLMWDVTQPDSAYNYRFANEIIENDYGIKAKHNIMTKVIDNALSVSSKYKLFDMFLWRGGLFTILSLILLYYIISQKTWSDLMVMLPFLGNLISLILSMSSQDYRYVYFEFYIIWFIIGTIFIYKNSPNNKVSA